MELPTLDIFERKDIMSKKEFFIPLCLLVLLVLVSRAFAEEGFYTGLQVGESKLCKSIDMDHVVSKKEAYTRGLPKSRWKEFENDEENLVLACASINRSKGASNPKDFLRKSQDGKGLEYTIIRWDEYLTIYNAILKKYSLRGKI